VGHCGRCAIRYGWSWRLGVDRCCWCRSRLRENRRGRSRGCVDCCRLVHHSGCRGGRRRCSCWEHHGWCGRRVDHGRLLHGRTSVHHWISNRCGGAWRECGDHILRFALHHLDGGRRRWRREHGRRCRYREGWLTQVSCGRRSGESLLHGATKDCCGWSVRDGSWCKVFDDRCWCGVLHDRCWCGVLHYWCWCGGLHKRPLCALLHDRSGCRILDDRSLCRVLHGRWCSVSHCWRRSSVGHSRRCPVGDHRRGRSVRHSRRVSTVRHCCRGSSVRHCWSLRGVCDRRRRSSVRHSWRRTVRHRCCGSSVCHCWSLRGVCDRRRRCSVRHSWRRTVRHRCCGSTVRHRWRCTVCHCCCRRGVGHWWRSVRCHGSHEEKDPTMRNSERAW